VLRVAGHIDCKHNATNCFTHILVGAPATMAEPLLNSVLYCASSPQGKPAANASGSCYPHNTYSSLYSRALAELSATNLMQRVCQPLARYNSEPNNGAAQLLPGCSATSSTASQPRLKESPAGCRCQRHAALLPC
jgi:hypothetical protein